MSTQYVKVKVIRPIFYVEETHELVKGKSDWGSNPYCWTYLDVGTYEGEIEDEYPDMVYIFDDNDTTISTDMVEIIEG